MKTSLEHNEENSDHYNQDEVLWGKGMMDMVKRAVAATERGQKEDRKAESETVCLKASIWAALMQTRRLKLPAVGHQPPLGWLLKSMSMPKPKPKPKPKSKPKGQPGTSTETNSNANTNTGAESHIVAGRDNLISADTATDQMQGDGPTTKRKDAGQSSPCPDSKIEHGRMKPHTQGRQKCSTAHHDGPRDCISDEQSAFPPPGPGAHQAHERKEEREDCVYNTHALESETEIAYAVQRHHQHIRDDC